MLHAVVIEPALRKDDTHHEERPAPDGGLAEGCREGGMSHRMFSMAMRRLGLGLSQGQCAALFVAMDLDGLGMVPHEHFVQVR